MVDAPRDTFLGGFRRAGEWMLLAVVAVGLLAAVVVPRLAGGECFAVLTGSMRPAMPPGTLVVVRPVDVDDIGLGSVITYQPRPNDPAVVTHRVVGQGFDAAGQPTFTTRGDANDANDPQPVRAEQVVGKRWYFVPYLGYVTALLTGAQRAAAVRIAVVGLLGYASLMFAGSLHDRVRRPREPSSA